MMKKKYTNKHNGEFCGRLIAITMIPIIFLVVLLEVVCEGTLEGIKRIKI